MRIRGLMLATAGILTLLIGSAANASENLALNPDFAGTVGTHTDFTGAVSTMLVDYAAAPNWLIWAGQVGGRVRTTLERSTDWPGNVLHVWVNNGPQIAGIDEVFLPVHTGPKHANFCIVVKVVAGTVGFTLNDQGQGRFINPVHAGGSWVAVRGAETGTPVNQVAVYAMSPDAEFFVRHVTVTTDPIARKDCQVQPPALFHSENPPTPRLPNPYPWTQHPEQNGVVQPAGNPAQGNAGSPNGFFNNMTPGSGNPHNDTEPGSGHEAREPRPGKAPATGQTPSQVNPIQQQQPAQPATQQ